ncbi:Hypothetical predicted protein, partial [Marmota monax]
IPEVAHIVQVLDLKAANGTGQNCHFKMEPETTCLMDARLRYRRVFLTSQL